MAWLTNWNYRKAITVSNSGSSLSDYQVLITVDTLTLVNAGKMQSDCRDIRFTSSDGSTLLNYWIESGQNTSSTKIWIKSTLANGNNTVYMYYGNPSAASASDGNTTFYLYDHFLGTSYDTSKWTVGGIGNVDVASSVASIYSTVDDGLKYLASSLTFGIGYAVYFYGYMTFHNSGSEVHVGFNSERDATGVGFLGSGSYWTKIQKFTKPPEIVIDYQMTRDNSYHTWKVIRKSTTSNLYQIDTIAVEELTTSIPTDNETVMIRTRKGNDKFFVDYVFVTKYASPEPTFGISGTEELNITAIDMILNTNTCAGPCQIIAGVTWQNLGSSDVTFTPAILIDGIDLVYGTNITIPAGGTNSATITTLALPIGSHTICPYPN